MTVLLWETLPMTFLAGLFARFAFANWEICSGCDTNMAKVVFGVLAGGLSVVSVGLAYLAVQTVFEVLAD